MKKQFLAVSALMLATPVMAVDITANGGLNSEYIFRGVPQSDGDAAAFGGADAEWDLGFYAGTWASTVDSGEGGNDGLEIDVYGGWTGEVGDFTLGAGITLYRYTDSFDDDYNEVNLSAGWSFLTVNIDIGEYENFDGPDQDYQHSLVQVDYNGFYANWGSFYDDFDGDYFTGGYGNTLNVADTDLFDYSLEVIHSTDDLLGSSDTNIVVEISKSFDVFSN
ncbi:MAG: TorF family putative porin [Gammaproteobacteria bacterium]